MGIVEGFVTGAATQLGHECVKRHADDIAKTVETAKNKMESVVEKGWENDYQAGGISSWNSQEEQEFEPA